MNSPSEVAKNKVLGRMGALYNSTYASLMPNFVGAQPCTFNFDVVNSNNVVLGEYKDSQISKSTSRSWPFMALYVKMGTNATGVQRTKGLMYSGNVIVCIDQFITATSSKPLTDFETPCNIHEATMLAIFNDCRTQNQQAFWSGSIYYNGDMSFERSGIADDEGRNWLRKVQYKLLVGVELSS